MRLQGGPGPSRAPPHSALPAGLMDTCRECGARALELVGQLQEQQALLQAQPGLVRTPLQGILRLGQVKRAAEHGPGPEEGGGAGVPSFSASPSSLG